MKTTLIAALLAAAATTATAAPEKYTMDASHSQIVFTFDHLGFSTITSMYSGFEGDIMFDQEDPANSSVTVAFPTSSLITGWDGRTEHFLTDDFFGAEAAPEVSFVSTGIEVTGETTANITGDLTLNGITKAIVLDATLNLVGDHPIAKKPWAGFSATTTVVRSDFDMGLYAPYVSDEVAVMISIEAMKAE